MKILETMEKLGSCLQPFQGYHAHRISGLEVLLEFKSTKDPFDEDVFLMESF